MIDFFISTYIGGILCIIIGLFAIWVVKKSPEMAKSAFRGDICGWAGGVGSIIIGICVLIGKLLGKL